MKYNQDLIAAYPGNQALALFRYYALNLSQALLDSQGGLSKEKLERVTLEAPFPVQFTAEGVFFHEFVPRQIAHFKAHYSPLKKQLARFRNLPLGEGAQDLIRHTLFLDKGVRLTTYDVRCAVLSSCLMPLRQTVGSCFATAPAKLIQTKSLEQVMLDLHELLYKGYLSRQLEDKEAKAPLCLDWVSLNLSLPTPKQALPLLYYCFEKASLPFDKTRYKPGPLDQVIKEQLRSKEHKRNYPYLIKMIDGMENHPLLRVWEYTLASYADFKISFSQYNLYTSVGLSHEVKGGVGEFIYNKLTTLFEEQKDVIKVSEEEIVVVDNHINMTQALIKQAGSIEKVHRYQRRLEAHLQHKAALTDEVHKKIRFEHKLSTLYVYLKDQYTKLFKDYFQEVYSPNLYEAKGEVFADAPAGFRLLYKGPYHEPHLWQLLEDSDQFVASLKDFFFLTLSWVKSQYEWEEGEVFIEDLITELGFYVESEAFIEGAKKRVAFKADNYKTPWSYISGGSMPTLMQAYFVKEKAFDTASKVVTAPADLLTFFVDTLKELPYEKVAPFEQDQNLPMLTTSPTHAFSLLPGSKAFRKGWEDPGFTYTWVRDEVITPQADFYDGIRLTQEEGQFLCMNLFKGLQVKISTSPFTRDLSVKAWSDQVMAYAKQEGLPITVDLLSPYLRQSLPLFNVKASSEAFEQLIGLDITSYPSPFISAKELFTLALSRDPKRYEVLLHTMQEQKWLPPAGLMVADTNWPLWFFSFVVSPIYGELELWRTDYFGLFGLPMHTWLPYLSEGGGQPWTLYTDPREYGFHVHYQRGIRA